MKSLNLQTGLLALAVLLLTANLVATALRPMNSVGGDASAVMPRAAADSSIPLNFMPARPQWLVTTGDDGRFIYVWKYDGSEYEAERYIYTKN